jgi:hypothetical protein
MRRTLAKLPSLPALLVLSFLPACVPSESNPAAADAGGVTPGADMGAGGASGGTPSGGGGAGGNAGGALPGGTATGGTVTGGTPSGGTPTGGTGATGGSGGAGGEAPGGSGGTGGTAGAGGSPGGDADADGVPDATDNCPGVSNPPQRDADADGLGDACDDGDADRDGVPDNADLCPAADVRPIDTDGDGYGDQCDVCPEAADPTQRDGDGDGLGDACDTPDDDDGDDVTAADDNCPAVPNRDQSDRDADGVGDACDDCPDAPDFSQRDLDADGIGDACDVCPDAPALGDSHRDVDGDGLAACAGDCDDTRREIRPGASELCDTLDNDCSGVADDPFPGLNTPCTAGVGACTRQGVIFCAQAEATECSAVPGVPSIEVCNRLDDDCDGLVDEELANCCMPGETLPCGTDVGACSVGTQTCSAARTWSACDGQVPVAERCNGVDDDCNGVEDDNLGLAACGVGRCARLVPVCENGLPGACEPLVGAVGETCNGQDDDCDGVTDDGFDLLADEANCGFCGNACAPGTTCENGSCGGRNVVMLCGNSQRNVATFLRGPAANMRVVVGCAPDADTVALLVTRDGAARLPANAAALRAWVANGGAVIGEYDTTPQLAERVLQLAGVPRGAFSGGCLDEIVPQVQFHTEDATWRDTGIVAPLGLQTGCGFAIERDWIPGFVPLGGDSIAFAMLGYVEVGLGRLWLVESDWQDGAAISNASLDLMAWMIAGWRPSGFTQCQNGFDDDLDGSIDLWDTGCTGVADATEGDAGVTQCTDGADNNNDGSFDYPYDPGCAAAGDNTERAPAAAPRCANGLDDDRDGRADFPADSGCHGAADDDEDWNGRALACADGMDNDGTGVADYPTDQFCDSPADPLESWQGAGDLVGVQENLPLAAIPDWRICHQDTYQDARATLGGLRAACDGAEIMLACRVAGSDTLTLAAKAPRADVFFDVGVGAQATHLANGVQFYFDEESSMGFAPEGVMVDRNTCDFLEIPVWNPAQADFGTGRLRMCWHTAASHLSAGFRCGLAAPFDTTYERLILTR